MNIRIARYGASDKAIWDAFVKQSRNATFLFFRDYMDYHADRFSDCSLMIWADDKLVALLPANVRDNVLYSHAGLTYGGLITGFDMQGAQVLHIFEALVEYARENGFKSLHYKPIPTIYHKAPAQDDEYALWRLGAELETCTLSSVVDIECSETESSKRKKEYYRQLLRKGYSVCIDSRLDEMWPMLESNLKERHNVAPVHNLEEIKLLQSRFPDSIKCVTVRNPQSEMMGGVVLYVMDRVLHMQYSCSCPEGMKAGAMNFLYEWILDYCHMNGFRYYDMGISTEQQGHVLNESLDFWKWSFGGRGVAFKTYYLKF